MTNNPLTSIDPDGRAGETPCNPPDCWSTTVSAVVGAVAVETTALVYSSAVPTLNVEQKAFDWLSQPRNGNCLAASTGAGASVGGGLGWLGLAGGPAVGVTEPTAIGIGGGLGWAGGMISCMSGNGGEGGQDGGGRASGATNNSKPPVKATKLKGSQGWRDEDGNIWRKDMLHKDHWDVSDRAGKKIKEVTFDGRELWPNGPQNAN